MVDVIDVPDAFEAKRKRAAKPVFEVERWAIGGGCYVRATLTGATVDRIDGFATEGGAGALDQKWICRLATANAVNVACGPGRSRAKPDGRS